MTLGVTNTEKVHLQSREENKVFFHVLDLWFQNHLPGPKNLNSLKDLKKKPEIASFCLNLVRHRYTPMVSLLYKTTEIENLWSQWVRGLMKTNFYNFIQSGVRWISRIKQWQQLKQKWSFLSLLRSPHKSIRESQSLTSGNLRELWI